MAKLIYGVIASLDGFVADREGNFDWAEPDEELHRFINEQERPIGTYLYGRRMYDVMRFWQTPPEPERPDYIQDYARIWQAADKIVYSRSLDDVTTARTRLERHFDPAAIRRMKASFSRDISVGGPHLAAQAIRAGLVDEIHLSLHPIIVGAGNPALPDDVELPLELLDERRFRTGVVHVDYRVKRLE